MGTGAEAIEDLGDGDDGQGVGDNGDDLLVLGKEKRQVEAEGAVHGEVKDTNEATHAEGLAQIDVSPDQEHSVFPSVATLVRRG